MDYEDIKVGVDQAWQEFYHSLVTNGLVNGNKIDELDNLLNRKDCFNDVFDCVMEVAR